MVTLTNLLWSGRQVRSQKFFLKFARQAGHRPIRLSGSANALLRSDSWRESQQSETGPPRRSSSSARCGQVSRSTAASSSEASLAGPS